MHFWSLHFGSIPIFVPKLISLLMSCLKKENQFYFIPCRQPTNRNLLRSKWSAPFADITLTWSLKYY